MTPPRVQHARAIRISGQTDAEKRVTLATRVMGLIESLPVKQGQRVERGDLIMRLDAEDKEAAIRMAESVVAQREAEADAAAQLVKGGNAPKLQTEQTRAALATAQSQLENAKAELAQYEIHAPFNGLIDRVPVQRGSTILAGAEVATLINLDPLLAIGEVSERDLRYLKIGDAADIRLVDGKIVKGTLRYISRDASSATRTFRIEVAIPNEDKQLPAGMTAEITLLAEDDRLRRAAALGRDAQRSGRSRHPRRRQGQQGRVLPDRPGRRHADRDRAGRHSGGCQDHRRRPGPGHRRR